METSIPSVVGETGYQRDIDSYPGPQGGYLPSSPPPPYGPPVNCQPTDKRAIQQQPTEVIKFITGPPRTWSTEVDDCCADKGIFCYGWCCPWCLFMEITDAMGFSDLVCYTTGTVALVRTELRMRENIEGSPDDDLGVACCCRQCALCQMARELEYIKARGRQQGEVIQTERSPLLRYEN